MALSPAEKQRAYRQRQKAKKREAMLQGSNSADYKSPFSAWAENDANISDYELALALAGIEAPSFEDERGPEHFVLNDATQGVESPFGEAEAAIGRAEIVIGSLIDAAATLAGIVNAYKRNEIKARIAELEKSKSVDRATAMAEAVRLNKVLELLNKQVQWSFPQWK